MRRIGLGLSIIGLIDSSYLLYLTETERPPPFCNVSAYIDCGRVEFSAFSHFLGVPDPLLGVLFFAMSITLWLKFGSVLKYWWALGVIFSGYLIFTEVILNSICLYCMLAQACCIIQGIFILRMKE
ncbi:Vitamin K epoxide reductase [Metallosphaera sedula]|uniref:Vitamin K epoxide reductase n=3 Tax=Metallosphaera TaxID=41980 RepID=A4YEX6_METS5|nr:MULTISPECIES: vitamin K epoxide reductase family protein [Metallosphaera]ABP94978.1 Vitamin K epoxide reductase [Metallosphaera sedula DSM 5348]AIM26964.1 Vitamin K epoxide reductase [Metallosphaera sedula]AKV73891.1 vitamin K epoxide reductase [Metallosphaera sedula]AKV76133.1 vitamin K epoxide reductase [Metallosphaera sedula]AKV78384.1 vitamin K epoxide reductase [Metallosphaera sedula]